MRCSPLPPVVFGHGAKALGLEKLAQLEGCFDYEAPLDAAAGIEIENHLIRGLDVVDRRPPGMQFDRVHVDEP